MFFYFEEYPVYVTLKFLSGKIVEMVLNDGYLNLPDDIPSCIVEAQSEKRCYIPMKHYSRRFSYAINDYDGIIHMDTDDMRHFDVPYAVCDNLTHQIRYYFGE